MSSTRALEVKNALYVALQAGLAAVPDVLVTYGPPPHGDTGDQFVFVGGVKWDKSEWVTNRTREETFRIDIISQARVLSGNAKEADDAANALNSIVESYFETSPTFGLGNLVISDYSPGALVSSPQDETYYAAQFQGELIVTARF